MHDSLLRDLYGHQEWADAEHWRAFGACAAARDDVTIRLRLLHVHLVQRFFMFACGDGKAPPEMPATDDVPTGTDLIVWFWKGRPAPDWA